MLLWNCTLNIAIFGFSMCTGSAYVPSLGEFLVMLTLVSAGVVGFGLIAKYFPVFVEEGKAHG